MTVVGFLYGVSPSRQSVVHGVRRLLEKAGARVVEARATGDAPPRELLAADVVALRALDERTLPTAEALAAAGVRCVNTPAATAAARDKVTAQRGLEAGGVAAPAARVELEWAAARAAALASPTVVKAARGSRGRGVLTPGAELPEEPPFAPPYLLQEAVAGDGLDRKLYVVGDEVRGVARRWPAVTLADKTGRPFVPSDELRELALAAARALGLDLCGVDVVVAPDRAVVVDVNAFPGYKGVADAAELLARHLLAPAGRTEEVACAR